MSGARDEKLQINIFARINAVTREIFGQAEAHAKVSREYKSDIKAGRTAGLYLVVRESRYKGMITADYGYVSPENMFKTGSIRFALLDTFELASVPRPEHMQWREVTGTNIDVAQARLLKIGDLANASLVTSDVTSAQSRSLYPAILRALEQYHLPTHVRVLEPGDGQKLHGQAVAYYGDAYSHSIKDRNLYDMKLSPASTSLAVSLASLNLSTISTLFASNISSPSVASVAVGAPAEIDAVPEDFNCPISSVIMRNPVITADGHNYEDGFIRQWITQQGHRALSPLDNKTEIRDVFPNIELRNRIHATVLASPVVAKEFWSVHREAILQPRRELGEIDFSTKFKAKYAALMSEATSKEAPRRNPGT